MIQFYIVYDNVYLRFPFHMRSEFNIVYSVFTPKSKFKLYPRDLQRAGLTRPSPGRDSIHPPARTRICTHLVIPATKLPIPARTRCRVSGSASISTRPKLSRCVLDSPVVAPLSVRTRAFSCTSIPTLLALYSAVVISRRGFISFYE